MERAIRLYSVVSASPLSRLSRPRSSICPDHLPSLQLGLMDGKGHALRQYYVAVSSMENKLASEPTQRCPAACTAGSAADAS
jgi:hypothetical protein